MEVLHNISACSFLFFLLYEWEDFFTMIQARVSILRFPSQKVNCLIYSKFYLPTFKTVKCLLIYITLQVRSAWMPSFKWRRNKSPKKIQKMLGAGAVQLYIHCSTRWLAWRVVDAPASIREFRNFGNQKLRGEDSARVPKGGKSRFGHDHWLLERFGPWDPRCRTLVDQTFWEKVERCSWIRRNMGSRCVFRSWPQVPSKGSCETMSR